jgi:hypothetical protein
MTIVILGKELVQKSSVSELRRSRNEVTRDTQHRIAEMPKPDLKAMSIKFIQPQINWNMIGRLLFSLTVNSLSYESVSETDS